MCLSSNKLSHKVRHKLLEMFAKKSLGEWSEKLHFFGLLDDEWIGEVDQELMAVIDH